MTFKKYITNNPLSTVVFQCVFGSSALSLAFAMISRNACWTFSAYAFEMLSLSMITFYFNVLYNSQLLIIGFTVPTFKC